MEVEGVRLDLANHMGHTALHLAAAATHSEACLRMLLAEGAEVQTRACDGRTVLHLAAIHGRLTRVELLVKAGAKVDERDRQGRSALHIAAYHGHELLVAALVVHGADVDLADHAGLTPLHMAAAAGRLEAARKLVSAGAKVFTDIRNTSEVNPHPFFR